MDADAIGTERTSVRRATIYRGWQPRFPGTSTEERRPDEFAHRTGCQPTGSAIAIMAPVAFPRKLHIYRGQRKRAGVVPRCELEANRSPTGWLPDEELTVESECVVCSSS